MKKLLLAVLMVFGLALAVPATVQAATSTDPAKESVCEGVGLTGGDCGDTGDGGLKATIETAINVFSFIVGVAAVIMIIIGGMKYITSAGDSSSVNSAKNTILYAIVGLVVVLVAQSIVRFVILRVGSASPATPDTAQVLTA